MPVPRTRRRLAVALAALLVPAALGSACSKDDGNKEGSRFDLGQDISLHGRLPSGAQWKLAAPDDWNGTLLLYSHGFVGAGGTNEAQLAPDPLTQKALLDQGYAMVGTSYASTGWAVDDALLDQRDVLEVFGKRVEEPARTIAWGVSLGGLVTIGLLEQHPDLFDGGMPMCGPVAGSTTAWDSLLDTEATLLALVAPDVDLPLVEIGRDGQGAYDELAEVLKPRLSSPDGLARATLAAAFSGLHWTQATDLPHKLADIAGLLVFSIKHRVEVERRFGGNPSTNAGTDYTALLDASGQRDAVEASYEEAGLDLSADLATLAEMPRIEADPAARSIMSAAYDPTGALAMPVVSMHTTGDPLTVWAHESAYAARVSESGASDLLRQVAIDRPGHCTFTPAEVLASFGALAERLDTGTWPAFNAASLEASAAGLGVTLNIGLGEDGVSAVATRPAFTAEEPPPYPRSALGSP